MADLPTSRISFKESILHLLLAQKAPKAPRSSSKRKASNAPSSRRPKVPRVEQEAEAVSSGTLAQSCDLQTNIDELEQIMDEARLEEASANKHIIVDGKEVEIT